MKSQKSIYSQYIRGPLSGLWAAILVAFAVFYAVTPVAQAGELILHPGYIDITVSLPDPELPGEKHVITQLSGNASGSDSDGNHYFAYFNESGVSSWTLVVEGGDWPYNVGVQATAAGHHFRFGETVIVGEGETVTLNFSTDSWVELTGSVIGETVASISAHLSVPGATTGHPQDDFYINPKNQIPGDLVRLPVLSGPYTYEVTPTVRLSGLSGTLVLPTEQFSIASGENVVILDTVNPGYVGGKVSVLGAQLSYANLHFSKRDEFGEYVWEGQATIRTGQDGEYYFPMTPSGYIHATGNVNVGGTTFQLEDRLFSLQSGELVINNWLIDIQGDILASANISGAALNSVTYKAWNAEQTIVVNNYNDPTASRSIPVFPGDWSINARVTEFGTEPLTGISWNGTFDFNSQPVTVPLNGTVNVDFQLFPSYLRGKVLHESFEDKSQLKSYRAYAKRYLVNEYSDDRSVRYFSDTVGEIDPQLLNFELIIDQDPWQLWAIQLYFRFVDEFGVIQYPQIGITDQGNYYSDNSTWPVVEAAAEGAVVEANYDINPIKVAVNLQTSNGELFKNPKILARHVGDPSGRYSYFEATAVGESKANGVSEAKVFLYAISGTYNVSGSAIVNGVTTTFGSPFFLTVDEGDEVETDTGAPHVLIDFPVGNFWTCSDTVGVGGTITDESGVASFTLNGEPVTIVDGTFSHMLYDLPAGENILEFVATDTEGNTVTIWRTIYVDALPVAEDDLYEVQEEGLLMVAAPGVLGNDYDPDGNPLFVGSYTTTANGSLMVYEDGAFEYTPDIGFHGEDTFTYVVQDAVCEGSEATVLITVIPNNVAPVIQSLTLDEAAVGEGGSAVLNLVFTDENEEDSHLVTVNWGDGIVEEYAVAAGTTSLTLTHPYPDDDPTGTLADVYPISVGIDDLNGGSTSGSVDLTVNNLAPVITSLTTPLAPLPMGTLVDLSLTFADAGILDTHGVSVDWGDGSAVETLSPALGSASGEHVYLEPGVYQATVTVCDDDTGCASQITEYVVVFDPTGSFVTGGGWIDSPPGAFLADPSLIGKAHFGFVSRYQKGVTIPSGKTDFLFRNAGLAFRSEEFQWLVIAGPHAKFKGWGTINGEGDYGFMVTATDSAIPGGGDVDKFRIQLWERATDILIYDNQLGDDAMADASDGIEGGSINIHVK